MNKESVFLLIDRTLGLLHQNATGNNQSAHLVAQFFRIPQALLVRDHRTKVTELR